MVCADHEGQEEALLLQEDVGKIFYIKDVHFLGNALSDTADC